MGICVECAFYEGTKKWEDWGANRMQIITCEHSCGFGVEKGGEIDHVTGESLKTTYMQVVGRYKSCRVRNHKGECADWQKKNSP